MEQTLSHLLTTPRPPALHPQAGQQFWADLPPDDAAHLHPYQQALQSIAASAPYLRMLMLHNSGFLVQCMAQPPETIMGELVAAFQQLARQDEQSALMRGLRIGKAKAALLIALCDIAGLWKVEDVTRQITVMADAMVQATVNWLLREAGRSQKMHITDLDNPAVNSGYVVLAMGKHGAAELNYSSDTDLIVLYDAETAPVAEGVEPATFFVRLTKRLVTLLQDTTEDGYGLRVDLRLRPDPRATQVAISMEAAAIYYESMGQNWERAAMIKARPVAGDLALGQDFLQRLKPYIWRKYLDFAAIADVQSLKRQINAVKGHGTIATRGHNIKLGRGGIREIEFFVQTQQLIAGGRNPALRGLRTLEMLDALASSEWITPATARELQEAYRFLRQIEHRIQMVNDEQTHNLPGNEEAFESLARFAGFASASAFAEKLQRTLETVQQHYAALFEDAGHLGDATGSLVFTGGEDDPETLETLQTMGFRQASEISATIRGWHFGRYAATRSSKSRELLTELMPRLLQALAQTGDADGAFLAFDRFIAGLPAGVQLFSMIKANPDLLDLIARILGTAPRLSAQLSLRPRVLEAVLEPGFFDSLPTRADLETQLQTLTPQDLALDELADRLRVIGREQMFKVSVRILSETVSGEDVGAAYSLIAELLLQRLHQAVLQDMQARHGTVPGGQSCIVAMGKLGGREMTAGSDLDLMLVYTHAPEAEMSDGPKPLSASQYYTRLTQRLVAALTAPMAEGSLYEVDLRLRPSGNKGPVATSFASFLTYHAEEAWTWERMALTRARVVSGDGSLASDLQTAIHNILASPRDKEATQVDVRNMRQLMHKELGQQGLWDIKRASGGLTDVEFIVQYLQLVTAAQQPQVLSTNTMQALRQLGSAMLIAPAQLEMLLQACTLYQKLTQILRLSVDGSYKPESAPPGLNQIVARAVEVPTIDRAALQLQDTQARISRLFHSIFYQHKI